MVIREREKFIIFTTGIFIAILFCFAFFKYPVVGEDSARFALPAINFSSGLGLVNEAVDTLTSVTDLTGQGRANYYPPLYPMLIGYLLPRAETSFIFLIIALINSLSILLFALVLYKIIFKKNIYVFDWQKKTLFILAIVAFISTLRIWDFRPETLAIFLLLSIFWMGISEVKYWIRIVAWGICLGIMGTTHPAGLILAFLAIGLFSSWRYGISDLVKSILASLVIGSVVSIFIVRLSHLGMAEILNGTYRHWLVDGLGQPSILRSVVLSKNYIFWIRTLVVISSVSFICLAKFVFEERHKIKIKSPWAFLVFLFLSLCFIIFFTFVSFKSYYLAMLSPFVISIWVYYGSGERKIIFKTVFIAALFILGFRLISLIFYFPFYIEHGMKLEEARSEFKNFIVEKKVFEKDSIFTDERIWIFADNHSVFTSDNKNPNVKFIMIEQSYTDLESPPANFKGCGIHKDLFIDYKLPFSKLRPTLNDTISGYAFAVYDCSERSTK